MSNEEIKEIITNKWYEFAPNTAIYFDDVTYNIVIVSVRFHYKGDIKGCSHTLHIDYVMESQYLDYFITGLMNEYAHIIMEKIIGGSNE